MIFSCVLLPLRVRVRVRLCPHEYCKQDPSGGGGEKQTQNVTFAITARGISHRYIMLYVRCVLLSAAELCALYILASGSNLVERRLKRPFM